MFNFANLICSVALVTVPIYAKMFAVETNWKDIGIVFPFTFQFIPILEF